MKLSEATFGDVVSITSQTLVDEGSYEYTVPGEFAPDAGRPVPDNYPLRFTLTAQTVTMKLAAGAKVKTVELLRADTRVPFRLEDEVLRFTIPRVEDYEVAAITLG